MYNQELKDWINKKLFSKSGEFYRNRYKDKDQEYQEIKIEIEKITTFLPIEASLNERVYCILNNITEKVNCKFDECNNFVKFISYSEGYRQFCRCQCYNKNLLKYPDIEMNKKLGEIVKERCKNKTEEQRQKEAENKSKALKGRSITENHRKKLRESNIKYFSDSLNLEKHKQNLKNYYDNLTEEQYTQHCETMKKQGENFWEGLSQKDKDDWALQAKIRYKNLSEEEKRRIQNLQSSWSIAFWKDLSNKNKQEKCLKNLDNADKNYVKLKETWAKKTPEEIKQISEKRYPKWKEKYNNHTEEQKQKIKDKTYKTKKKNNSFNISKTEIRLKEILEKYFNNNVYSQYTSEKYPFRCDFYLSDFDLYIELQGNWTHGLFPFDENNIEYQKILETWKNKNTDYYNNAIEVWTIRDPLKRKTAQDNNLNYLEIWKYEDELDALNQIIKAIQKIK